MNKKKTIILLCSLSFITASVGYSAWLNEFKYEYSENNKVQDRPVAYIIGREDIKYTSIEKALDVAQSGDIVTLIPPIDENYHPTNNPKVPDRVTYEITRNCEIKPGVTLILPTDKQSLSSVAGNNINTYIDSMRKDNRKRGEVTKGEGDNKASYGQFADAYSDKRYLRVTVRIRENVKLQNNGTLIISGYLSSGSSAGASLMGHTSHSYAEIVMEDGASIVQDNANSKTYCYGYIKESKENNNSSVVFNNGLVYLPLILRDYKGFFTTSGIEDAVNKYRCSPFNQFEFRNIQVKTSFLYNSSLFGDLNIFLYQDAGNLGTVNQVEFSEFKVIGKASGNMIQFNNTNYSKIECKYNLKTEINDIDIYGGALMNGIEINITIRGITKKLKTANGYFPLSYRLNINLHKAPGQTTAIFDTSSQMIKLLPGNQFCVNDGVTLKGKELIVYTSFIDGGNGQVDKHLFSSGGGIYPIKDGAILKCIGSGSISMNSIAGQIYCDNSSNISFTQSDTITSREPWNFKQSGIQYVTKEYAELSEKLSINSLNFLDKKKIFVGNVVYRDPEEVKELYRPSISLVSDGTIANFVGYQGVFFFDENFTGQIIFNENVAYFKRVNKNSTLSYGGVSNLKYNENISDINNNLILYPIGSDLAISSNFEGKNEFLPASVKIKSVTPLVDGKDQLFIDKSIFLKAEIDDINKVYDKKVTWSSSDNNIATVKNGEVVGVSLGNVSIFAECSGVVDEYKTEVIQAGELIGVTDAWITDSSGKSSKKPEGAISDKFKDPNDIPGCFKQNNLTDYNGYYTNSNGETKFSLNYEPGNAQIVSVTWHFIGSGKQYMKDYSGNALNNNSSLIDDGSFSTTIVWNGQTNASPDGAVLSATIKDINNNETKVLFAIIHDSGVGCLLEGTKILMSNMELTDVSKIGIGDSVLVFNHEKGVFEERIIIINDHKDELIQECDVITLYFDNKITFRMAFEHAFFDKTLNKYIYLNSDNVHNYLNHEFVYFERNNISKFKKVKLLDFKIKKKICKIYAPLSERHLNVIADGFLTISPELDGLFNIFEFEKDTLKYDPIKMKNDIENYGGLIEYTDVIVDVPKEIFYMAPYEYIRIAINKGNLTWEAFENLINKYKSQMLNF